MQIDVYPVGAVIAFGASANTNPLWLPCDGRLVPKADYLELFDALQYTYGTAEGGAKFGLPDYRGRFQRGAAAGSPVGRLDDWTTKRPATPFSGHAYWLPDSQKECNALPSGDSAKKDGNLSLSCDGGGDAETRPVNVYVDYYIKVKVAAGA